MATLTLATKRRTILGKKVAVLRRAGITPANIYGHNVASTAIEVETHELDRLLRRAGRTALVTLRVDGETDSRAVLVKDVRRLPTTGTLLHVDFIQVSMTETLTVTVPLVFVGEAPVLETVRAMVNQSLDSVTVECLPNDIPQYIDVDLTTMTDATSVIHVRDLVTPSNVVIINDPDVVVAGISLQVAEEAAETSGAATAAEVPVVAGGRASEGAEA